MPPSHHSSSSHSSHSSFSSHSSSSFRSSSSRSSFSSSRPSSHSTTSHSSSYGASFGSSRPAGNSYRPSSSFRNRVNQPRVSVGMATPRPIRCRTHDYIYFPVSWVNNGTTYQAGYYDENGTHYDTVALSDEKGDTTVELECEYCGTRAKYKWEDGEIPACTHCGAPMSVKDLAKDTVVSDAAGGSSYTGGTAAPKKSKRKIWLWVVIGMLVLSWLMPSRNSSSSSSSSQSSTYTQTQTYTQPQAQQKMLYLKEVTPGVFRECTSADCTRSLVWSAEDESYYDAETEAWLWRNTDVNPPVWQYWFEGYSSDYGDYGWMEWENGTWYVEMSRGNWQVYPGDTSELWHIT